jgi:methylenetetrahydrofolate dehydrogenase (NADP+)/methenyltetrahydrofolate cyclohydrolase
MRIIDGRAISAFVKSQVLEDITELKQKGIDVTLAVIIIGDDPASEVYVRNKEKTCKELGIHSKVFHWDFSNPEMGQHRILELIESLNNDPEINGILCQLPLPEGYDEKAIIGAIKPEKDVDAFHPENVGHIMIGDFNFLPCTPAGIMEMLRYENIDLDGKNCVVIGRSNIVGKPMAMLMLKENATVTICHSRTKNLKEIVAGADVIVAAVGRPNFVTADMVKDGAVIIDVGINKIDDGKLCGDVDFEACKEKASYITPVPGGVGPMTIATLMQNTITAAKKQHKL